MESPEYRPRRNPSRRRSSGPGGPSALADSTKPIHSGSSLIFATVVSLVVATIISVVAILPAELGIDPTGLGKVMGLSKMRMSSASAEEISDKDVQTLEESASTADTVTKTDTSMRADTMSVTLEPGEGAEIKAEMRAGERFVFEWTSEGGPVNFDMHGEEPGKDTSSYWADKQKESGAGVFVAPVSGTHGWFWRNRGEGPVTVSVQTSGFYKRLFRAK